MAKKSTNGLIKFIQNSMNKLYQNTFYSQPNEKINLDKIKSDMDLSLDKLTDSTKIDYGLDSIVNLYSRLYKTTMDQDVNGLLNNKSLLEGLFLSTYTDNKSLREQDDEKDAICKYMPKLEDALKAKQDNILSADHYSRDYLIIKNLTSSDEEFKEKVKRFKEKYKLIDKINKAYSDTAHYGEQFRYVVPYKKALSKLLKTKDLYNNYNGQNFNEAEIQQSFSESTSFITYDFSKNQIISESGNTKNKAVMKDKLIADDPAFKKMPNITVEFNKSSVLESAFNEAFKSRKIMSNSQTVPNDAATFQGLDSSESIYNINNKSNSSDNEDIKVPGCIDKKLPRHSVVPLYMDDMCLGYYCIENDYDEFFPKNGAIDPMISLRNGNFEMNETSKKDQLLKYISHSLSDEIDSKFINANQDLTKEIYTVLKSNETLNSNNINRLRITYIPPEDMVHWYWDKDEKSNRGISDLEPALLTAKLYVGLYTSNITGYLTRGYDRRLYYVKQGVERNTSKVLMNVINQIKKANFNAREMTNLKHILNMQGKFNDFVIPLSSTGEPPIQFEIMPGQQIDLQTDFLNMLEEKSISALDMPYELMQSQQSVDYAVRLTMSSGRVLKMALNRQGRVKEIATEYITKLWNAEFQTNDRLEVELPAPAFLNLMNTSTVVENTDQLIESLMQTETTGDDQVDLILKKKIKRDRLSTYIDFDKFDKLKAEAKMEYEKEKKEDQQQ